jgi:hypothetical protein
MDGEQLHNIKDSISPPTLLNGSIARFRRTNGISKMEDVWIFNYAIFPNHFIHLFIPKVEELFQVGDKILRLEAFGLST